MWAAAGMLPGSVMADPTSGLAGWESKDMSVIRLNSKFSVRLPG